MTRRRKRRILCLAAIPLLVTMRLKDCTSFYTSSIHKSILCQNRRRHQRQWHSSCCLKDRLLYATPFQSTSTDSAFTPEDDSPQEAEIMEAYEEWRQEYERSYDDRRYENFKMNFLKLKATNEAELKNAREAGRPDPVPLSLNKYGDCSAEEYQAAQMGSENISSVPQQQQQSLNQKSTGSVPETDMTSAYFSAGPSEQDRIREIYKQWCFANGKMYDEARLDTFAFNLKVVENYSQKTGQKAELNQYADLSPEEYKDAMMARQKEEGDANPMAPSPVQSTSQQAHSPYVGRPERDDTELERIRNAYRTWCHEHGRQYQESRLEIFATNLKAVENYRKESGKYVKLNQYADLTPEEYKVAMSTGGSSTARAQSYSASYLDNLSPKANMGMAVQSSNNNPMTSYLENLSPPSPRIAVRVEDRIQKIYQDWCQYYGKVPDEQRLQIFASNLMVLEKHHSETGEELTLNEFADQLEGAKSRQQRAEEARMEEERMQEELRQKEEQARLILERRTAEEGQEKVFPEEPFGNENERIQEGKRQYEQTRQEEALSLQSELESRVDDQKVDSSSQMSSVQETETSQSNQDVKTGNNAIALPRSSYMDAVAKTWIDRSAYLESLQQGRVGIIPEAPLPETPMTEAPWMEEAKQPRSERSKSLINSIWDFMNDSRRWANNQYADNLIAQADEMIEDAKRSSDVGFEEVQYLQEAVDILRRRNTDERAAEQARFKAKEWQQIQQGLEREAKRAKERRQYEERAAYEAQQRAQSFESSFSQAIPNDFSFLPKNFQFGEANFLPQPGYFMNQGNENLFSFFGGNNNGGSKSFTKPVVVEKKESWLTFLFDFFGSTREPLAPGQGTITLEPAKKTTVFDFFVAPDIFAPRQPGRGSITIEEPKKPSIFSFLAKFGGAKQTVQRDVDPVRLKKVEEYENRRRSRQEKLSWLEAGRSRILEQADRGLSRKEARQLQRELEALAAGNSTAISLDPDIPQLAKWTRTPDGRITGFVTQTTRNFKMGTKITTSPIKGQVIKAGVTVTTASGSQYRLGLPLSLAPDEMRSNNAQSLDSSHQSGGSLPFGLSFGGLFAGENVPSLVEWKQNEDGTITGFVNNKVGFEDGTQITTSPVSLGARSGMIVQTRGGSKYKLLKEMR